MNLKNLVDYLKLDSSEFNFQFQSHPNYPSALAFGDTLNFMGVKNEAYELEKEYWKELPIEFITLYNNQFVLVNREGDKAIIYADSKNTISYSELVENSENIVFLFENQRENEKSISSKNSFQNLFWVILGAILLINTIINWDVWSFVYQVLSAIALYFFIEIFRDKFGTQSPVLQSFCGGIIKTAENNNGCESVFKSKDFQLFGLSFSDFGLIYFLGLVVLPLLVNNTSELFVIVSGLALFSIVYSLYYQISKKSFCKVCFLIIGILVTQFFIAFIGLRTSLTSIETLISLFVFVVSFFGVYHLSYLISEKEGYRIKNIKNLRFKRNYDIFKRELILEERVNFKNKKQGFFFGNEKASLHISMISNPFCGFCKDVHILLENLIKKYPNQLSFQIRFNYLDDENKEYNELLSLFDELYSSDSHKMLKVVELWYETKDLNRLKKHFGIENIAEKSLNIYTQIGNENMAKNLNFTPIILINGYQFPQSYDREDLVYFIEDLLEDDEL